MRALVRGLCALAAGLLLLGPATAARPQATATDGRVLDGFESLEPWQAHGSDGVRSAIALEPGRQGQAMRLDFDFAEVSGYAYARRPLPMDLPENWEISFWVRADAAPNTFQIKLTDAKAENVWWRQLPDFHFPGEWRRITIKKRQLDFAWGPTTDKTLRHADAIEFVVVRGKGGGKGSIWIDDLRIRPLPAEGAAPPKPMLVGTATPAPDGDPAHAWSAPRGAQSLTVDLGQSREFGGLELDWAHGAHASRYAVSLSEDGAAWQVARRVQDGDGGRDPLRLPEAEARYVRIDLEDGPGARYGLKRVIVEPLAWGASPNAFVQAIARVAPRGAYPRGFSGEQAYWTLVGVDGGSDSGLISEDGAIELGKGGPSVEPVVIEAGRRIGWADVRPEQSLALSYLPIPSVTWRRPHWLLRITALATGGRARSQLIGRYDLTNLTARRLRLKLALAVRPFQVNGPLQFLGVAGGVSPVGALAWDGARVSINGKARLRPLTAPSRFIAADFDAGAASLPADGGAARPVVDETGLASGALVYDLTLAPHATVTLGWLSSLSGAEPEIAGSARTWLDAQARTVASTWAGRLDRVAFITPPAGRPMVDTLRTSLAHMLMSRNGATLQPGTRSYDRSWIRDGAMIAEALDRMGSADLSADYLRWYAGFAFPTGKVPCCVDARGADPTPENDSQGELIYLAAEAYRYTGDKALLRAAWPRVEAAARYMDAQRASERTEANLTPERRMLYGLLPPSISHEGYSSKPAYSYWDDFWALRGYKDAVFIADVLGEHEAAERLARSRDQFGTDLLASITASAQAHRIDFIPGAADLGDFDATSTTIALAPGGEGDALPRELLGHTFERYWRETEARRTGAKAWEDYTPYELRTVGTFVRLGRRDRATTLLDGFLADRRPLAWNGWAEVVGRDARKPRFIGDMPHAWVSSDYVRSALDLFTWERERDHALVLGAGLPAGWYRGKVGVRGLRTPYGRLDWSAAAHGRTLTLTIGGDARPPGGYVFPWPFAGPPGAGRINGRPVAWSGRELRLKGPGVVNISLPTASRLARTR